MIRTEALVSPTKPVEQSPKVLDAPSKERGPGSSGDELKKPDKEKDDKRKKRKRKDADANISAEDIDKKERKRRKREQREAGMASKRRPHENDGAGVSDPQPDGPVSVVEDDLSPQTRDERKKRTKKKDKLADRDGEANERSPEYSKSSSHPSTDTVLAQGDQPNSLSVKKKHRVRADDDSPHADLAFDAQHRKKKRRKKQDTE
ncbi:hypothetical protein OF83DRAFT_1081543 [Amylostereum chailletii]|nr:hypothetical protein OF83DRAFT_1081543 [Amylostereum chailletii]